MASIEVTFGITNSPLVSDAVSLAKKLPGFQEKTEGKRPTYSVAVPLADAISSTAICSGLLSLIGISLRWQSTRLTLNGEPIGRRELDIQLRSISECFKARAESEMGDEYCSGKQNPAAEATCFGCRKLGGVSRSLSTYGSEPRWFHFGAVSQDSQRFDVGKPTIIARLEERAEKSLCRHCPAFNLARVRADVETLPDSIDLGAESGFEIHRSAVNPERVLGIQPRPEPKPNFENGIAAMLRNIGIEEDSDEKAQPQRTVPTVRYSDVAGMDRAVGEIRDVVELPIKQPAYFTALGLRPHRGVILYGPPGNGKTLLVKAVATESDAHLEIINGPEVLSKWVGEAERKLRDIFERAKQLQPSIVLIDEIDAISSDREGMRQHHDVVLISQLLALLDGIEDLGDVFVIGTTNRLDAIDPAIRRPGRFDYHIYVPLPDAHGRLAILGVHLARLKFQGEAAVAWLAESTEGWSGAELAAVCREAGLVAIKRAVRTALPAEQVQVTSDDLRTAFTELGKKRSGLSVG
jgi:transitional endoplasmic reticulum ATPase